MCWRCNILGIFPNILNFFSIQQCFKNYSEAWNEVEYNLFTFVSFGVWFELVFFFFLGHLKIGRITTVLSMVKIQYIHSNMMYDIKFHTKVMLIKLKYSLVKVCQLLKWIQTFVSEEEEPSAFNQSKFCSYLISFKHCKC